VADLTAELEARIALLASDRESGASEILDEAMAILAAARTEAVAIIPVARALCRAQPSMASVWTAALEAVAASEDPGRFDRFAQRLARSSEALGRFAQPAPSAWSRFR